MNFYRRNILLVIVSLFAVANPRILSASALSDAAQSLQPGEWTEFSTSGYGNSLLDACNGNNTILEWANKATWNPINREVRFVGQGHLACAKHIVYQESTNSWSQAVLPSGIGDWGHAYEHNAIDPQTGNIYYRHYNSDLIERFNPGSNSWTTLPNVGMPTKQVAGALEYFPERNGLIFVDGDWGVYFFNSQSNSWSLLANTNAIVDSGKPSLPMGSYNNSASYNPAEEVVYFGGGGGSSNVYMLDSQGQISQIANSPVSIGINSAMSVPDPISGAQLVFSDNGNMYSYDRNSNQWRNEGTHPIMSYARNWRVVAPITTYGIIMVLTWDFDNSKVLLYRHAEGGVVVQPKAPSSTTVQ